MPGSNSRPNVSEGYEVPTELPGSTGIWLEDKNSSRMWVYPPNCRTKVGARWSPSFPRQSLARRRARNIVQVHAHALNGSRECYHVVRIGLGAIWGDHGRRRSLHFTTPPFCLKKGWVYPLLSISHTIMYILKTNLSNNVFYSVVYCYYYSYYY